jgi:hypothetical protein
MEDAYTHPPGNPQHRIRSLGREHSGWDLLASARVSGVSGNTGHSQLRGVGERIRSHLFPKFFVLGRGFCPPGKPLTGKLWDVGNNPGKGFSTLASAGPKS